MIEADAIDAAISAREAEIDKLRKKLEVAEHELRGMKNLRCLLLGKGTPEKQQPANKSDSTVVVKGGRQPGAISTAWRMVLSDVYHDYKRSWFPESALPSIAAKHGIEGLRPKDAKERLTSYVHHGYVEQNQTTDDIWRVTENAAKRFGFLDERLTSETKTAPDLEEAGAV